MKNIYNIVDFGAKCKEDCTNEIQKAIDTANQNDGGIVIIPNGEFNSKTLYLKSDVILFFDENAVLKASGKIEDYSNNTHYNRYINESHLDRCFIFAENCRNIGLAGFGKIDGNATAFHNDKDKFSPRPMMIRFLNCKNVKLENLKLINAASWTTAFLDCEKISCKNLFIRAEINLNGDGLDFDGCEDVLVENCDIKGSDDNICFQCHKKERKMKNAVVVNCTLSSICDNVRIGMKSVGDIENITIKNCFFNNGYREGVKIESSEGGEISKINIFNIKMRNVRRPFYFIANNLICSLGIKKIPQIGKIKNVCIKDIEIVDDEEMAKTQFYMWGSEKCDMGYPIFGGIKIDAHKNYPLENITLQNINYINFGNVKKSEINNQYPPVYDKLNEQEKDKIGSSNYYPDWSVASHFFIRNVKNLTLENINLSLLNPDERDKIIIINCIGKY